jgi:hypothetical protein
MLEIDDGIYFFVLCAYKLIYWFYNVDLKAASLILLNILRTIFISFTSDDSGRSVL